MHRTQTKRKKIMDPEMDRRCEHSRILGCGGGAVITRLMDSGIEGILTTAFFMGQAG
jgi:hypothetical protein